MILEQASYEINEKTRQHEEGEDSTVNILRFLGGAKGKILVL